jgi:capsular exopolysaccharide synthesis family protein
MDWSNMVPMLPGNPPAKYQPSIMHRVSILRQHWWKIALFVLVACAGTLMWIRHVTPMYESTATIDADRQAVAGVVGEDADRSFSSSDSDEFLATQMKLIQSDAVLRPVAQKYDLLHVEKQRIRFDNAEAPIELKNLKVVRSPRTQLLYISYAATDPHLAANVANAVANSYILHTYRTRVDASAQLSKFMEAQLGELKQEMEVANKRQAEFARELDVVDPEQKTTVLSARLMELNTEYTKAQADRVAREASFKSLESGGQAAVEVSGQATSLAALAERVNGLQSAFVSVKSLYGENHPQYKKAAADLVEGIRQYDEAKKEIAKRIDVDYQQALVREDMLHQSVVATKADLDKLASRALDYEQLKQEAQADTKLYEELVRRTREAGLNSGFQGNAIRMADAARPAAQPVSPRPLFDLAFAFCSSLMLAVGVIFLGESLHSRVHGPDQVQQELNTRLIGTLPDVRRLPFNPTLRLEGPGASSVVRPIRSQVMADEVAGYAESIRRLRNILLLAESETPIRSLLVTSALAGEGKSTTALHLAMSRASQRKRTLLIDADLRYPTLHTRLGLPETPGLAAVLTGAMSFSDAVLDVPGNPDLFILPAGRAESRASDLVGPGILTLLAEASQDFDFVVIDAPPLLAFAEALQLATAVDGVAVITCAGSSSTQSVSAVLSALASVNARVVGVVLNRFRDNRRSRYYGERQYAAQARA